ncbi:MAG: helix-turn-helix transcriptional regulator [bacterium]
MIPRSDSRTPAASLITVKQLAELLNVSTRHLHRMRSRGTIIEPIKLGRMTRWSLEEVESWIRAGCPVPVEKS